MSPNSHAPGRRSGGRSRRKQVAVALVATLAAAALLAGAAIVGVRQARRNATALVGQSMEAEQKGDLGLAIQLMSRYLTTRPDDANALARYALLRTGQVARAEKAEQAAIDDVSRDVTRALAADPRNPRLYLAQAALAHKQGRKEEVVASLRRGIEHVPGDSDLKWRLAGVLLAEGRADEVGPLVADLRAAGFSAPLVGYLEGRILIKQGDWARAAEALEKSRQELEKSPDSRGGAPDIDLLLGQCYDELKEPDLRLVAYRRAVDSKASPLAARKGYARALADTGRFAEAAAIARELVKAEPALLVDVARWLFDRNTRLPVEQRRWAEVEQALDAADQALKDSADVSLLRANVSAAQGKLDVTRTVLTEARDHFPDRPEFWVELAVLTGHEKGASAELAVLDEAERRLGDRVELRLGRANAWARAGGEEASPALGRLEDNLDQFSPEDRRRLLLGLATARAKLGADREADRLWDRVAAQDPKDVETRMILLERAAGAGDAAAANRYLDEIRRAEGGQGPRTRLGEIVVRIGPASRGDREALRKARELATALAAERPSWLPLIRSQARIEDLGGDAAAAFGHYQRAIALGDTTPGLVRRAVELLYTTGKYAEADRLLGALRQREPFSGEFRRLVEDLTLRLRGPEPALALAQEAVTSGSRDYRDYLSLARLLTRAGKEAEAEPVLRQAVDLAADVPDTWVALIEHLVRRGQMGAATAAVGEAEHALAKAKTPAALARCYELIGRAERAEALHRAALAAAPNDPSVLREAARFDMHSGRFADAERRMRALIAGKDVPPADASWARRNLALLLSEGGDDERCREALTLLGAKEGGSLAAGVASVEDERIAVIVLARRKRPSDYKQAAELQADVTARSSAQDQDRLLLIELYEKAGDWPRARASLLELVQAHRASADYLALAARAYLRHGETSTARSWFGDLKQVAPGTAQAVEVEARLLHAEGKSGEAADLIARWAENQGPEALDRAAALLEELGQPAAAEAMYRRHVARSDRPEAVLALARFLGRHDRFGEALDACGGAWGKADPDQIAAVCVSLFAGGKLTEEQRRRVSGWLEEAVKKSPQSPSLPFRLAVLRELEGRYPEAEVLYRQAIDRGLSKSTPFQSLARLLALREGRGGEALGLIDRALAQAGPRPDLLDTRAVVYLALGRHRDALDDLERAAALQPGASVYFHLSQAYLSVNDPRAAATAFRKAVRAGLGSNVVHPLERATYGKLVNDFGGDGARSSG